MNHGKKLIIICGPTASGKTALAIDLALHYQAEIISADSRQFYREMNIGTAKPSAEELAKVRHHFINNLSIEDTYTAGMYERDVISFLEEYFKTKDIAIMVGGSGLFIKAVCDGFDEVQTANDALRDELATKSLSWLQEEVERLDPAYFAEADTKNPRRLIRALEVIYATGKKYSEHRTGKKATRPFEILKLGIDLPKEALYQRINERVDTMIAKGLVAEAQALFPKKELKPLQTVGYQELVSYFEQQTTLPEAIEKIKQNSRNYAKRQMTWFRKDEEVKWFDTNESTTFLNFLSNSKK